MKVSLKAMRVNAELTQEQVTQMLGKKDPHILIDIESGKRDLTYNELLKLCDIYGCTIDDIILPKI